MAKSPARRTKSPKDKLKYMKDPSQDVSVHREEVELLKRRAYGFLEEARLAARRGFHDGACFLAEQAVQLFLKAVLLEVIGDYPRTHSIRRLLGEILRILRSQELEEFIRTNKIRLSALEDAYLMARYFIKEYDEDDSRDMLELAENTIKLAERVVRGWLRGRRGPP